ncbi:MAG: hypothetical protein J4F35_00600 [Candidatus Latescibacteria bacterium]|nr:hypothetical protein [Candidatus Latescibacterota bacterium]
MASVEVLLSFGVGLAAVGLIYVVVRLCRSRASLSPLLAELLASRVQYALAGLVLGLLAPLDMRPSLSSAADLAAAFLVGIFGLLVGCSIELRLLRHVSRPLLLLEIGYLVLLGLGLWALSYGFSQGGVDGAVLWGVCGLGAACWIRLSRWGAAKKKKSSGGLAWVRSLVGGYAATSREIRNILAVGLPFSRGRRRDVGRMGVVYSIGRFGRLDCGLSDSQRQ